MAYMIPMATFLALLFVGGQFESFYPFAYVARAIVVAILLIWFWPQYTPPRTRYWWLGVIVGVLGIAQWIGMQLWLQAHFTTFRPSPDFFNPMRYFETELARRVFFVIRTLSAVVVVPVMEELFWRDYLWRTILAPNDFKLAEIGERNWRPIVIVTLMFATVHGNWWPTAIVWAAMIAGLLVYTRSIGACIVAHATTNLLLAAYVMHTRDWSFW